MDIGHKFPKYYDSEYNGMRESSTIRIKYQKSIQQTYIQQLKNVLIYQSDITPILKAARPHSKAPALIRDVSRHIHFTRIDTDPVRFQEITFNIMLDVPCLEITHTHHINTEPSGNIAGGIRGRPDI